MNLETVDLTYFIYAKKDTLRCAASCYFPYVAEATNCTGHTIGNETS